MEGQLYTDIDAAVALLVEKEGDAGAGAVPVEGAHRPLPALQEPEVRAVADRTWEEMEHERRLEAERRGDVFDLASAEGLAHARLESTDELRELLGKFDGLIRQVGERVHCLLLTQIIHRE